MSKVTAIYRSVKLTYFSCLQRPQTSTVPTPSLVRQKENVGHGFISNIQNGRLSQAT